MDDGKAQGTVENGGVQVKAAKQKTCKIPRISKGPMCYSMFEWALRLSFTDMIIGGGMAFLFFYLLSTLNEKDELYEVSKTMFIIFGIIFSCVFLFGLMLAMGLLVKKFKILLRVYCWYAFIIGITVLILFIATVIYFMVISGNIGTGLLGLLVGVIVSFYEIYMGCLIHSIYQNIVDGNEKLNRKRNGC